MTRIDSSVSAVAKRRWSGGVRALVALALLVTGLSITQPAQAADFDAFQWSLGEDCTVPLQDEGSGRWGDPYNWRTEWAQGTQVPVCKAADGASPLAVGSVAVELVSPSDWVMGTLGVMRYKAGNLTIDAPATEDTPSISMLKTSHPYEPWGATGNAITVNGVEQGAGNIKSNDELREGEQNQLFAMSNISMTADGVPSSNTVTLAGGQPGDGLPREVPIEWETPEPMVSPEATSSGWASRNGRATTQLTMDRILPVTGQVVTYEVTLYVDVRAVYSEGYNKLTFVAMPDGESQQIDVAPGQTVTLDDQWAPERPGYSFWGWSTETNGAGHRYQVGDTYTAPEAANPVEGVTLYGVWVQDGVDVVNRYAHGGHQQYPADNVNWSLADSTTGVAGESLQLGELHYGYFIDYDHFGFKGWSTEPDGGGTFYPAELWSGPGDCLHGCLTDFILPPGTTNLYTQWSYRFQYFGNDAEASWQSSQIEVSYPWAGRVPTWAYSSREGDPNTPTPVTVLGAQFTRPGYQFIGWNSEADGSGTSFQEGDTYIQGLLQRADGSWYWVAYGLWAQWAELLDVSYEFVDGDGNSVPAEVEQLLPAGEEVADGTVVTPATLGATEVTAEGGTWVFRGWDSGEVEIHADHTFVGTWEFVAAPVTEPGETPDPSGPSAVTPGVPSDGGSDGDSSPSVSTGGEAGHDAGMAGGAAALILGLAGLGWWRHRKAGV